MSRPSGPATVDRACDGVRGALSCARHDRPHRREYIQLRDAMRNERKPEVEVAHATSLPRLTAGQVSRAAPCSRHLAQLLDPDRSRGGGTDPSFRLWRAVHDALHLAHRAVVDAGGPLVVHLPRVAPPELGVEEQRVFTQTIEHYDEAFGDDEALLDARSGDTLSRPSACGRYHLSAQANLIFRRLSSPLEIRRVKLRARPSYELRKQPGDVALAALLRPPNESSDVVATVHTLWVSGEASVTTQAISSHDVDELRSTLHQRVDAAYADLEQTAPGWWCGTCPFVLRCPAIPQDSPETLLHRWTDDPDPVSAPETWLLPDPDPDRVADTDADSDEDW